MPTLRIEGDLDTAAKPERIVRILESAAERTKALNLRDAGQSVKVLRALADTVKEACRFCPDGGRLTATVHPAEGEALDEGANLTPTLKRLLHQARDAGLTGRLVEVQFSLVISDEEGE